MTMTQKKLFRQAPLPFIGQKRMFLKHFESILNENIEGDGEGWTIIDTFGGSGLLSHVAKHIKPKARVIYNDFDGYAERVMHIDDTNRLRAKLYEKVVSLPIDAHLSDALKAEIVNEIEKFDGYKDLNTLASWFLFSGSQAESFDDLYKLKFFNGVRKTDYPRANGYLEGVEIIGESFHTLLPKFAGNPKALFVLDPPYICTKQESYKQATYFDLVDFLRLINITRPPYIFFSSTKSEFLRFIEYMQADKVDNWQTFDGAKCVTVNTRLNFKSTYEDNLVYKF